MAGLLYALLVAVRVPWTVAAGAAGLLVVFPWASTLRLWSGSSLNQVCVCLFLLGALLALRLLSLPHRPWLPHLGATALYVAAILTYEAVGILVLGVGLLYLAAGAPLRAAGPRWALDILAAGVALLWSRAATTRDTASPAEMVESMPRFAGEGLRLLAQALPPGPLVPGAVRVVVLLVFAGLVVFAAVRRPEARSRLRTLGLVAVGGLVAVAAATVPFLGTDLSPLNTGQNNRGNIAAALPWSVVVASAAGAVAVAAVAITGRLHSGGAVAAVFTVLLVVTGLGFVDRMSADRAAWRASWELQERTLRAVTTALRDPRSGDRVFVSGVPAQSGDGIAVFAQPWDLSSAAVLRYRRPDIGVFPFFEGTTWECGPEGMFPVAPAGLHGIPGEPYGPALTAPYGLAVFVDVRTARARRVENRAQCLALTRALRPGPLLANEDLLERLLRR